MSTKIFARPKKASATKSGLSLNKELKKKMKTESNESAKYEGAYDKDNESDSQSSDYDPDGNQETWNDGTSRNGKSSSANDRAKVRQDNSLSILTRKFIHLIKTAPDQTIDVNEAVKELNVQKRRIYDITNVLEGIGYLEKVLKNKVKWVGNSENIALESEIKQLTKRLEEIYEEEKEIDFWTATLENMLNDLAKDETNKDYSYVTFDDIRAVTALAKDDSQPFLVVRAPKGTTLEIPTSEPENEQDEYPYKMKLTSNGEEILIYVVANEGLSNEVLDK